MTANSSPAALRNRGPIADILAPVLPASGQILLIAEGTGEHAVHFARRFTALDWRPSDPSAEARASILAHREAAGLANLHEPLALDAAASAWPVTAADAVVCINMLHISPWAATEGLMAGAGRILPPGGLLFLYGPYREVDRDLAPSNAAFDHSLKARNPAWGLRALGDVRALAAARGLSLSQRTEMPANNLSLCFRKD